MFHYLFLENILFIIYFFKIFYLLFISTKLFLVHKFVSFELSLKCQIFVRVVRDQKTEAMESLDEQDEQSEYNKADVFNDFTAHS